MSLKSVSLYFLTASSSILILVQALHNKREAGKLAKKRMLHQIIKLPVRDFQYKKCETAVERRLYIALKALGYFIQTQTPICHGRWRTALMIPEYRLVIECETKRYPMREFKYREYEKEAYLRSNNWSVMRFPGRSIFHELDQVLETIEGFISHQEKGDPIENMIHIT